MKSHSVLKKKKTKKSSVHFLRSLTFGHCDILRNCKRLTLDECFHKREENIVKRIMNYSHPDLDSLRCI